MNPKQLQIIFEDAHLIAINKPSGLLVLPHRIKTEEVNLKKLLESLYPQIYMVHRLDRDTSGIILVAKDADTHKKLNQEFQEKRIEKIYWTLVNGKPNPPEYTITLKIAENNSHKGTYMVHKSGADAITHYKTIELFRNYSLLEIILETGKTHQIRVHMSAIGNPLAVDPIYGIKDKEGIYLSSIKRNFKLSQDTEERPIMNRLTLHAKSLSFKHPHSNEKISIEAPLPKDFMVLLKLLKEYNQ